MTHSASPVAVAAIVAVYRGDTAERVKQALDSLIHQQGLGERCVNVYVGVDGPVLPDLLDLVRNYADRDAIELTVFEQNRGVAPVVNDLLKTLKNEQFIFRLDADDEAFPDRFAKQIGYFNEHHEVDVLGTALLECRFDGTQQVVRFPEHHDDIVNGLYWRVAVANPTVCFRRHVLDATQGYPVQNLSEDLAMWFACTLRGYRFANMQEPLVRFTVDQNFWARRGLKRAWREYLVWSRGVWVLHGASWRLMGPVARLGFRLIPKSLRRYAYASSLRKASKS